VPGAGAGSNGDAALAAERRRIGEAMLGLVAERGYAATTVREVLERAEVSRAGFKRLYAGKQECFLRVYEELSERFSEHVLAAFEAEGEWLDGLRVAAYAAARWIRDHPRETRYVVIEMVVAGEFAQARREATLRRFVDLVDSGRELLDEPDSVTRSMAEGAVGGVLRMLTKSLRQGAREQPENMVPQLMFVAVRPYLGQEAALEELRIPPPPDPDLDPVAEGA
jgi:AcrR family transcriptional regulator